MNCTRLSYSHSDLTPKINENILRLVNHVPLDYVIWFVHTIYNNILSVGGKSWIWSFVACSVSSTISSHTYYVDVEYDCVKQIMNSDKAFFDCKFDQRRFMLLLLLSFLVFSFLFPEISNCIFFFLIGRVFIYLSFWLECLPLRTKYFTQRVQMHRYLCLWSFSFITGFRA